MLTAFINRIFKRSRMPSQAILCLHLDKRAVKHLKNQQQRGKVACFTLEQTDDSSIHVQTPEMDCELKLENFYQLARTFTDELLQEIQAALPDFFQVPIRSIDFKGAFAHRSQLLLGNDEVPFLVQCATSSSVIQQGTLQVMDSFLSAQMTERLFTRFQARPITIQPLSTFTLKDLDAHIAKLNKMSAAPTAATETTGGLLAISGCDIHQYQITPAIRMLQTRYPVHVYHYTNPDSPFLQDERVSFHTPNIRPNLQSLEATHRFFQMLSQKIALLPTHQQARFCLYARELLQLARTALIMESLCEAIKPDIVLGCLEKNSIGPTIAGLRERLGFQVFNFQHGRICKIWAMDHLSFDRFFVWDTETQRILEEEGYYPKESLALLGNADVTRASQWLNAYTPSPALEKLKAWKQDSKLLLAATQVVKGYHTVRAKQDLLDCLSTYLAENPDTKLVIRKHPSEKDRLVEEFMRNTPLFERVKLTTSDEMPLWEVLQLTSVVVSSYSTTLVEAGFFDIPALAIDYQGVNRLTGMPMGDIYLAENQETAHQYLSTLLKTPRGGNKAALNQQAYTTHLLASIAHLADTPPQAAI